MRIDLPVSAIFLILSSAVSAQSIEEQFNKYASGHPVQKIHIHTDRNSYRPGETIWFKAYLAGPGNTNAGTVTLYTEIWEKQGGLIERHFYPVINGAADGQFKLPDSLKSQEVILRYYTSSMLPDDTSFLPIRRLSIIQQAAASLDAVNQPGPASVGFFPEGGMLVNNCQNYVAFKAVLPNGIPFDMGGKIKDSKGNVIDSITSFHDGMGVFHFIPEDDETYFCEWVDNQGEGRRTYLPVSSRSGVALHMESLNNKLYYLVSAPALSAQTSSYKVIAQMNQSVIYQADIEIKNNNPVVRYIPLDQLPSGILQFTVFNSENQPLAERISFVNNNNFSFGARLSLDKPSPGKRDKNELEIEVPDTLETDMSLSVYDAALPDEPFATTIYAGLLIGNDIHGYVHNPGWYFLDTAMERKKALDLVMQTNGWRKYNWDKVFAAKDTNPVAVEGKSLSVYGRLTDKEQNPQPNQALTLIIQSKDSTRQWYMPLTGSDGYFRMNDLLFYDTATVYYKINDSKKMNLQVALSPGNGFLQTFPGLAMPDFFPMAKQPRVDSNTNLLTYRQLAANNNPAFEKGNKMLKEVVVKARGNWHNWRNDPVLKMDEKYTVMFPGGANTWKIDVLNDPMADANFDIYNYIVGKVPGVRVDYVKGASKRITQVNQKTLVDNFRGAISIYLNEQKTDADFLQTIQLSDVAYLKYYEHFFLEPGIPPALCIYLKKPEDRLFDTRHLPGNLSKIQMQGYTPVKEFYQPDYSVKENRDDREPDIRTTLLWLPYVSTGKKNNKVKIPFYNNDVSTSFKIVLEGVNEDGKMIHLEKVVN